MKLEGAMPHQPVESARDDTPANLSEHVTDRRQFLRWGAFATAGAVSSQLPGCAVGGTLDTLREPMSLSSSNGVVSLDLVADYVSERIPLALAPNAGTFPAASTMVDTMLRRYAGSLPAPTLRCKAGDTIRIRLINRLPPSPKGQSKLGFLNFQNGTNLHFHGLHVSPEKVGELYGDYVVDSWDAGVMPGQQRQHEVLVPKGHPPGVFWYHPHLHGSSGGQVASGMFGAILIEDAASSPFDPSVNRERVIFVHKYNLNGTGRTDSFYDSANTPPSAFFLNGSFQPTIVMRPGEVQVWHFINSATFYAFNPVLDGHTLLAYARDGDPIPEGYRSINAETVKDFNAQNWPLNIQKWPGTFASPGSRISVFVKASDKPGDYLLRSAQSPWTTNPNLPLYEEVVARVRVEGDPLPHTIPTAPNTLQSRFNYFLPITDQERKERCHELLVELGLDNLVKSRAIQLSGGEKRRLAIARCLVTRPTVLLLDEPFSGVDPLAVYDIQQIILTMRRKGIGVLITDHNVRETLSIVDRAYLICEGKVESQGTADYLINDPVARGLYLGPRFSM